MRAEVEKAAREASVETCCDFVCLFSASKALGGSCVVGNLSVVLKLG